MSDIYMVSELAAAADTRMVLVVIDGLGGLPDPVTGLTELEAARTPNLDALAKDSICGLIRPVGPGITPGSAPGHLALFGYDPVKFLIGRGVLSAVGTGVELAPSDIAARVNFCTVKDGVITDRRAGRISTDENARLCEKLKAVRLEAVDILIKPEREHRAALVFRGPGLSGEVSDTDPQRDGLPPLECRAMEATPEAERTARLVNQYMEEAARVLAGERTANMIIARGFSEMPHIPEVTELYGIRAVGIASYPMYRAVASLVGMDLADTGDSFAQELDTLKACWGDYDYFFVHYKATDSRGEDGDYASKVRCIEEVDAGIPGVLQLEPDVLVVTGDHSTPAVMESHSWHPVPVLLRSRFERKDGVESFGETACLRGGLGIFPATDIMPMILANAGRLEKFGA